MQKITLPKKKRSSLWSAKNAQYSTYNGAEGREKFNEPGKTPNPQDHTWQYLNKSGAFDHSWTNAVRLITADVAFNGEGVVLNYEVNVAK